MRILFVFLTLATASANAAVYTLDPDHLTTNTDVTGRIPGVLLQVETVPRFPLGTGAYRPSFAPLYVFDCVRGIELCPNPSGKRKFGNAFSEGEQAFLCITLGRRFCEVTATTTLNAKFSRPANYVSFVVSWFSDEPVLFAFDAAGRVVAECHSGLGIPDDCGRVTVGDRSTGYRTRIWLLRPTADIVNVFVSGSYSHARIGEIKLSIP